MVIPYGDLLLLVATLVAWAERLPERKMLGFLSLTWLGGRFLEGFINTGLVWHWSLARIAVIIVFLVMAWRRASHPVQALVVPSLVLLSQDLLIVNEPGVLPPEHWLFAAGFFLAALLTSQTYWGTAVGVSGGLVLSELFNFFALKGIVLHRDIPDPFLWHFTLAGLVVSALGQKAWHLFKRRRGESLGSESLGSESLGSESFGAESLSGDGVTSITKKTPVGEKAAADADVPAGGRISALGGVSVDKNPPVTEKVSADGMAAMAEKWSAEGGASVGQEASVCLEVSVGGEVSVREKSSVGEGGSPEGFSSLEERVSSGQGLSSEEE